jgi:hypothetical protein
MPMLPLEIKSAPRRKPVISLTLVILQSETPAPAAVGADQNGKKSVETPKPSAKAPADDDDKPIGSLKPKPAGDPAKKPSTDSKSDAKAEAKKDGPGTSKKTETAAKTTTPKPAEKKAVPILIDLSVTSHRTCAYFRTLLRLSPLTARRRPLSPQRSPKARRRQQSRPRSPLLL